MSVLTIDGTDDPLVGERVESFGGGVDAYRRSTLIDPDQIQLGENVIIRNNFEDWTRPGADKLFNAPTVNPVRSMFFYNTPAAKQLIHAQGGKLYKYDGAVDSVLAGYSPADVAIDIAQGVDTLLITDGVANMQTYNGLTFTDCGTGSTNPPTSCSILCFHTGRMFAAGNPIFNDTVWVSNRLAFGAGQWDTTQRSFRIGGGEGDPIVAMASMQGFVLVVMKKNIIHLVTTDPTAEPTNFQDSQATNPLPYGVGCVGKKAWATIGNDLMFYSQDGIRSVQRMLAAVGQYQLSAPLSQPIQPYIDRVNQNAWSTIFAVRRGDLCMFFVPLDAATSPNTVLVYNWRLGKWLGIWTGWTGASAVETFFNSIPSHLVIGDSIGQINQWKDLSSTTDDATYLDNGIAYGTKIWTRSFLGGEATNPKSSYNVIIRFSAGNATINLTLVTDNAAAATWSAGFNPTGDILGVGTLPFLLSSNKPSVSIQSLLALPEWNESYLRLETVSGWFGCRNLTHNMFMNSLNEFPNTE